jgi:hypothetical protein
MAGELSATFWVVVTVIAGGLAVLAIGRPWRFLRVRTYCPQCKTLLPRWNCWGWMQVWICSRCGCQVGR